MSSFGGGLWDAFTSTAAALQNTGRAVCSAVKWSMPDKEVVKRIGIAVADNIIDNYTDGHSIYRTVVNELVKTDAKTAQNHKAEELKELCDRMERLEANLSANPSKPPAKLSANRSKPPAVPYRHAVDDINKKQRKESQDTDRYKNPRRKEKRNSREKKKNPGKEEARSSKINQCKVHGSSRELFVHAKLVHTVKSARME